jgi:hypothetical protein
VDGNKDMKGQKGSKRLYSQATLILSTNEEGGKTVVALRAESENSVHN